MKTFIGEDPLFITCRSIKINRHPFETKIVRLLSTKGFEKLSIEQMGEKLNLSKLELNSHLFILKRKGILSYTKLGTMIYYYLNMRNPVIVCMVSYMISHK